MSETTVTPCLSHDQLLQAKKILIIGSVAIGDFVYLQSSFRALRAAYPHLQIDLWLHDPRVTSWIKRKLTKANLKKYVVAEWIETCGLFDIAYTSNYSQENIRESIAAAHQENYDIVVAGYSTQPHQLISYAREIAPRGHIVASWLPHKSKNPITYFWKWFTGYRHAHALYRTTARDSIELQVREIYAQELYSWSGVIMTEEETRPKIEIPEAWKSYGQLKLLQWGIPHHKRAEERIIFINIFAKGSKRCWTIEKAIELIKALQTNIKWHATHFVLNAEPHQVSTIEEAIKKEQLSRVHTFSAQNSFYQIPAVLEQMDLVISVDTSTVHIASAFDRPIIDLMPNRTANFVWRPYDPSRSRLVISPHKRLASQIAVDQVLKAIESLDFALQISLPVTYINPESSTIQNSI